MKHIVLIGACYIDTILTVPYYPQEDSKLRATQIIRRRGGNCPNSLEVIYQLLTRNHDIKAGDKTQAHLVSALPDAQSSVTAEIKSSFGQGGDHSIDFSTCIHREGVVSAASSYIIRSEATSSRTIVNFNDLAEMTSDEFAQQAGKISPDEDSLWHFEGRIPDTTLDCIRHLRTTHPRATVSVEVEKPGREGLEDLAAAADVIFYSRSWAESRGYRDAVDFLEHEAPKSATLALCTWGALGAAAYHASEREHFECKPEETVKGTINVVDTVGAGDTFIAGVLYTLVDASTSIKQMSTLERLSFGVGLATRKVMREGFDDLAQDMMDSLQA